MKNKLQLGRPMLEMLAVLSIGVTLTIFGIFTVRKGIYIYKANVVLDYINSVYSAVRGKSSDSIMFGEDPQVGVPCEKVVSGMPSLISECKVTFICGCGSNTEKKNCNAECDPHNPICAYRLSSKHSCVATVAFHLKKGEKNTATTLESRLGLEVREEMQDGKERTFCKANCLGDYPQECANGFAECVRRGANCSDMSRIDCKIH